MLLDNIPAALYKHLPCLIIPANVCEEPAIPPCLPPASASLALLCFGTEQVKGEKDEKHHFSHPLIKFQQSCVFSNNTGKKKKKKKETQLGKQCFSPVNHRGSVGLGAVSPWERARVTLEGHSYPDPWSRE